MCRARRNAIRSLVDRAQALHWRLRRTRSAPSVLALGSQLPHDTGMPIAAATGPIDGGHFGIQRLVGCALTLGVRTRHRHTRRANRLTPCKAGSRCTGRDVRRSKRTSPYPLREVRHCLSEDFGVKLRAGQLLAQPADLGFQIADRSTTGTRRAR